MLEKVSKALWSWWEGVKSAFDVSMTGEPDAIKCPSCQCNSVPIASSSLGPVMKCSGCGLIFTARKF